MALDSLQSSADQKLGMLVTWRTAASSGSMAKSFTTSSRVVMQAMVTERSTTGVIISQMARSTATGTTRFSCSRSDSSPSDGEMVTKAARLEKMPWSVPPGPAQQDAAHS